ncbi:phosphopentomutase [Sulfobacillus harzensis]|uniref:Phosphopentomutase n=1 Tax=Sulfobacillus harzensis TaxID=2729629 RepID=A0A7Y0Q5C9_9FIRM|nr:phosphopentomutase [Sulfobacillus harzensis]NMP24169.1 phosphopentomutase [Sulfobacillus harzensis]
MQVVLIVIDSGGIGAAPDAERFGDTGANTITHALEAVGGADLPHLAAMGLDRLTPLPGTRPAELAGAAVKVAPRANGKDTLAGHWEMMGLVVDQPFPTYPDGFPMDVVKALTAAFGRPILGNRAASGTEIIAELGAEHMASGKPIVYTSADSVLQIAAHEEVVPVATLYQWCEAARQVMQGPNRVGRIIARPFIGTPGHFERTPNRHDYAVEPWQDTMVDRMQDAGIETVAVGKIGDIFSLHGFDQHLKTVSNRDGLEKTRDLLDEPAFDRFIFTNLVQFDSHYGHRRDPMGYVRALQELDRMLPEIWARLGDEDQLWITADHGCDPTFRGTDHTREWVPWLTYGAQIPSRIDVPRHTLADMAATLAGLWQLTPLGPGHPWRLLLRHEEGPHD